MSFEAFSSLVCSILVSRNNHVGENICFSIICISLSSKIVISMLFILIFFLLVLLVISMKMKYFTLRGPIPGRSPQLFVGNLIQFGMMFDEISLAQALIRMKNEFGDVFQYWIGPARFIAVNNINDVQYIYNHRQIYDHSDFLSKNLSVVFPDSLGTCRGSSSKSFGEHR